MLRSRPLFLFHSSDEEEKQRGQDYNKGNGSDFQNIDVGAGTVRNWAKEGKEFGDIDVEAECHHHGHYCYSKKDSKASKTRAISSTRWGWR